MGGGGLRLGRNTHLLSTLPRRSAFTTPNMPVTVKPATHAASSIRQQRIQNTLHLLKEACYEERKGPQGLLQSSFNPQTVLSLGASPNGFVKGAIQAYSDHHHHRIRPEDVRFAVLSQCSLYINAHAEEFRGKFVAHTGQIELEFNVMEIDTVLILV